LVLSPTIYGRNLIRNTWSYLPTEFCYYGVDTQTFSLDYEKFDNKDQYKIKCDEAVDGLVAKNLRVQDNFIALFTGAISNKRNPSLLIDAFDIFARNKNDVLLWMVGHNSYQNENQFGFKGEQDLLAVAAETNCISKIMITQDRILLPDVYKNIYLQSDVYVLPTIGEGFGLPILEAMACETVPLTTNYTSGPELILNSGCGWLIPTSGYLRSNFNVKRALINVNSLAQSLEVAYNCWKNDRVAFEQMRKNGRKYAAQFTWDNQAARLSQIIKMVVNNYDFINSDFIEL
jgi:glycosyltransferase involved in cell wall biosynthesis